MLHEIERHENATVIIYQDDETGKFEIAWFDNENPPLLIMGDENKCYS